MKQQTLNPKIAGRMNLERSFALLLVLAVLLALVGVRPAYAAGLTLIVDTTSDANLTACTAAANDCSLRGAINAANSAGGSNIIAFDGTVFFFGGSITLGSDLPNITSTLTIAGPGATLVNVNGNSHRLFYINSGANLSLNGLTLSNGSANDGGAIYNAGTLTLTDSTLSNNAASSGGAIYNAGRLTVTDSTVSSNSASGNGGGIFGASSYTLTITDSTLSGNSAAGDGGGININSSGGSLTVINSTLYGNSAGGIGGGINYSGEETETLRVINSTLSGNSANFGGGINRNNPDEINQFILNNSIIANNNGGNCGDVGGVGFESYNTLFGDDSCDVSGGSDGNLVGDPQLSALADNGGATQTMALQPGSPAINAGSNALAVDANGNPLSYDQRGAGYDRIAAGTVDMGAYELEYTPDFVVDRTDDPNVAICSTAANDCSLRGRSTLPKRSPERIRSPLHPITSLHWRAVRSPM